MAVSLMKTENYTQGNFANGIQLVSSCRVAAQALATCSAHVN